MVGDLVGNRAEQKPLGTGHALVAHDDEIRGLLLGHVENRVGGIALTGEDLHLLEAGLRGRAPRPLEQLKHVGARADRPLRVLRDVDALAALLGDRLIRADDVQPPTPSWARSTAACRAICAVGDPSVPATMDANTAADLRALAPAGQRSSELSDRDDHAGKYADDDGDLGPKPMTGHPLLR